MKSSLSFDRAAGYYDRTREFPETFATNGIEAILKTTGQGAKILDVGTGTGRVSVPLLRRGADLIGCDLSLNMMEVLRRKIPGARLVMADAALLPFPSKSFDAVTTCHVMHLVGPWREALREYRRLLKPAGVYINARTDHTEDEKIGKRIRDFWESRVSAHGASSKRPGIQNPEELHTELRKIGASLEQIEVARAERSYSLRETIQDIAERIDSHTWVIPDEVFGEVLLELQVWAEHEFEDLDATFTEESIFVLDVARFP